MRSGPPTTTTDVRLANTPAAPGSADRHGQVTDLRLARPAARVARRGRRTRITARPVPGLRPSDGAFERLPIAAPHHHHVVVDVLCGCEDEILGDDRRRPPGDGGA